MLMGVQPQPDMAGKDLVPLLTELGIELPGGPPDSGTVLLPFPCPALVFRIKAKPHEVRSRADEDGEQASIRPADLKRVLQCGGEVFQQFRQTATQRLRQKQRCPQYQKIEKQAEDHIARPICFFQPYHLQK